MKISSHSLFPTLAMGLCSLLAIGFLTSGPSAPGVNEILSPAPDHFSDTVLSQYSGYFSDHFFGRQELITGYAQLNARLFSSSVRDDVLLGKEGWLYYSSTLPDYRGENHLNIGKAAYNIELMAKHCAAQGVQFLFVGVPNKNTLYPNHMPEQYHAASTHDLHRLNQVLSINTLDVAGLSPAYFAHDSHWNSRGAALAADAINNALGVSTQYSRDPFVNEAPHQGDLFEMLYPAAPDSETDPVYGGTLSYSFAENSGRKPDSITIRTKSTAAGSLLMYRDSFGNFLYPYLADSYGQAVFSRSTTYDLSQLDGVTAVVIELVERNLNYLTKYIPIMPAPKQGLSENCVVIPCELTSLPSPIPGFALYQGTAPNDCIVSICTADASFPCFQLDNGGFAAHLPESLTITGITMN